MKSILNKYIFIGLTMAFFSVLFTACSSEREISSVYSQDEITQAINNSRWNFTATNAMPSYGNSRNLSGDYYFVKCVKDTLVVALPYYGKLNSPAGALTGNPLDFKTTNFTLAKEDKKGGGWLVTITRPDREVQSMMFTFYDNGSAQVNVVMTNRSAISFSGTVAPVK